MTTKSLYRLGLISALFSTVGWLFYLYGFFGANGLGLTDDPAGILLRLNDDLARYYDLVYGWGGVLGSLATIPYIIAFYYAAHDVGQIVVIPVVIVIVGVVLVMLSYFGGPLSAHYTFAPAIQELEGADQIAYATAVSAVVNSIEAIWIFASFLAFGLGVGWFALLTLRVPTIPKWLSWLGMLCGIAGLGWIAPFFDFPSGIILAFVNIFLVFIWSIGMGIATARMNESTSERAVLRPAAA